jgi:hypothetical protein
LSALLHPRCTYAGAPPALHRRIAPLGADGLPAFAPAIAAIAQDFMRERRRRPVFAAEHCAPKSQEPLWHASRWIFLKWHSAGCDHSSG